MHSSYIKEAKATFRTSVKVIRERMELKEREISGEWMTEERMQKSGDYSKQLCSASLLTKNPKPRNLKLRNPKALNYTLNPKRCVCVFSSCAAISCEQQATWHKDGDQVDPSLLFEIPRSTVPAS